MNIFCEMTVKDDVLSYIANKEELLNAVQLPTAFTLLYTQCFKYALSMEFTPDNLLKIDAVIDYLHDKLHTGHWSKVPTSTRCGYASACFVKALILIRSNEITSLCDALKNLDMGILLGAPLIENESLLQKSAARINQALMTIKRKSSVIQLSPIVPLNQLNKYSEIDGKNIRVVSLPSLEMFIKDHFCPEIPIVITDAIQHWPASEKWVHLQYLLQILGNRIVPVEIGSQYSDEDWSQKLMTFEEYVKIYYTRSSNKVGYLAQHDLFYQVPELKNDFSVPDYSSINRTDSDDDTDVAINAWIGPEGTVSSLHYDPKDNLLAQVYGIKQVIMFSPADSVNLYPHTSDMLFNTAQVDPTKPNIEKFPNFKNAKLYKCLLQRGDMLYIPRKWWHHVTSLDRSFSINFWWS